MRRATACLVTALVLIAGAALAGCPGGKGLPGGPGIPGKGEKADSVDPDTCGNYAASEAGAKLKNFLEATVQLNSAVADTEAEVKASCKTMAEKLGIPADGDTKAVCKGVADTIRDSLKAGLKAEAKLKVDYKPAVCTINVQAAADVAAKCEAHASGEVKVTCSGTCSGTCNGTCEGKCAGKAGSGGSGGKCKGECEGTCKGECSGGCAGSADVDASAECKTKAEVSASVDAECTPAEYDVSFDSKVVVDKPKVDKVVEALKAGMPKLLTVAVKVKGPLKNAFVTWSKSAASLAEASGKLYASLGDQAACVVGQLAAAASMVASVDVSINVQVEASASVSGSAGGGA